MIRKKSVSKMGQGGGMFHGKNGVLSIHDPGGGIQN